MIIAARFAAAKTPHAISTAYLRNKPVTRVTHRLDRRSRPELLAQAANADVDDIGTRVERVAPDVGEEPLPADHLPCVESEMMEESELAI
jgi:hypothetical protein